MSVKPLYSKMLRDLGFDLTLDNIFLNNTSLLIPKKQKKKRQVVKFYFQN